MTTPVVIGRFQVPDLHSGHHALLARAMQLSHNDVPVVLVGYNEAAITDNNPLSVIDRVEMIREYYPQAIVKPLPDHPSDVAWSASVDALLSAFVDPVLYGGRDSGALRWYTGMHKVHQLPDVHSLSGTQYRASTNGPVLGRGARFNYRCGVIAAANRLWPTAYPVVDVAFFVWDDPEQQWRLCVGQKPGEPGWRLPGGFVSPSDASLEHAASRELNEETGIVVGGESGLHYAGSCLIDDYRYRGSKHGMISSLFCGTSMDTALVQSVCSGDDLHGVQFIGTDEIDWAKIMPAHRKLMSTALIWLGRREDER